MGISLKWALRSTYDYQNIYRSVVPFDESDPLAPLASIGGSAESYNDTTTAPGTTYYYAIEGVSGSRSKRSPIVAVNSGGTAVPAPPCADPLWASTSYLWNAPAGASISDNEAVNAPITVSTIGGIAAGSHPYPDARHTSVLAFNGSSYFNFPAGAMDFNNSWTLEFDFYLDWVGTTRNRWLLSQWNIPDLWAIYYKGANNAIVTAGGTTQEVLYSGLSAATIYQIVFQCDGTTFDCYIEGNKVYSKPVSTWIAQYGPDNTKVTQVFAEKVSAAISGGISNVRFTHAPRYSGATIAKATDPWPVCS